MQRSIQGTYSASLAGGERVNAYVPAPLPPHPSLDLGGARQTLLEQATVEIGRLDSISTLLPDPQRFLYGYIRREAVLSSQIEGTQSSLSDLLLYELDEVPGVPVSDVVDVSNYVAALEHGVRRWTEGFPLCNRLLREMHVLLMAKGRGSDKLPGEFRRTQNWIGGSRPGNAHFVPPPPQEVEPCMSSLEAFFHDSVHSTPVLVKAALAHVQFETIHPFLDGNGRLGRLLIVMLLHDGRLLSQPLLYLSLYFKQHRDIYYALLDGVRMRGEWEAWIDFFLEGVVATARGAISTATRLVSLFQEDEARAAATGRGAANVVRVLGALRQRPICNLRQASEQTGLSFPTVSKAMRTLASLDIAHELTGNRRNRVFVYDAYLGILNEDSEPL